MSLVSKDDVVNIFLSASDLSGLRRELAGGEGCEGCKESREVAEAKNGWKVHEPFSCATAAESAHCTWANGDWLSYN